MGLIVRNINMAGRLRGTFPQIPPPPPAPNIVTSGLIMNLDAGNSSSYSGSGTTWTDLSGNGYNGTLKNNPPFNNGIFTFNGSTQGVDVNPHIGTSVSNNFTYNMWCVPTATHEIDPENALGPAIGVQNQRYLIWPQNISSPGCGTGISIGTNGVSVYEHSAAYMPALLVSQVAISNTVMSNIVIVYTNRQPSFYLNGNLIRVGQTSTRSFVYPVTNEIASSVYGSFQGNLSVVTVYNRALNQSEITQNFNALRGRYGL